MCSTVLVTLPGAHTFSSRLPSLIASGSLYIGVDTCFDVMFGFCHRTLAYIRLGETLKALKPSVWFTPPSQAVQLLLLFI